MHRITNPVQSVTCAVHDALTAEALSKDKTTGEVHLRHCVTADGYYRGEKVIRTKEAASDTSAE